MDEASQFVVEMNQFLWERFRENVKDVTAEEADWRPVPQANTINLILRHLLLEAREHLDRIERGGQDVAQPAGSVSLDFQRNLNELDELYTAFIAALRRTTLAGLEQLTARAYRSASPSRGSRPPHLLAYHQAMHLVGHWGQISAIRNLYRKTRGEPTFLPDNPTFPTQ